MKQTLKLFLITSVFLGALSCNHETKLQSEAGLSGYDKKLADSLKIDSTIIMELKQHTTASLEPFHYSLSKQFNADHTETELDPIRLNGLVFKEAPARTETLMNELQANFKAKGYFLFKVEQNFGIGGNKDVMAILKTTDQYEVIKQIKTDGINYNIDTDSLIKIVKQFDSKYSLSLTGTSGDWCEFKINKEPADWMVFAKEAYAVCPDIVDQGTGTVEALADELKKSKKLYFWWD
ncbi:MAG: DUF4253 domain-containing protein [Bacteroidota bacterium]